MKKDKTEEMIDQFGEAVDKVLIEKNIQLLITLPEGTLDASIISSFDDPTLDFYIMLHGLKAAFENLLSLPIIDQSKKEQMLDGMLDMVKDAVLGDKE